MIQLFFTRSNNYEFIAFCKYIFVVVSAIVNVAQSYLRKKERGDTFQSGTKLLNKKT
jgi:hypothetical protein